VNEILSAVVLFWMYFFATIGFLAIFLLIYTRLTPHKEFDLIFNQHNSSAALAFGLTIIGFSIAMSGVLSNTRNIIEFLVWATVALTAQLIAYVFARVTYANLSYAIEQNAISAAIWLGTLSIAVGIITASSMSY
jgi:putative membrane protein